MMVMNCCDTGWTCVAVGAVIAEEGVDDGELKGVVSIDELDETGHVAIVARATAGLLFLDSRVCLCLISSTFCSKLLVFFKCFPFFL